MKSKKPLKICDDKIIKKACKKNYKYSKSYQYKKDMVRNEKNYNKNILNKGSLKNILYNILKIIFIIFISCVILFFLLIAILLILANISK